MKNVYDYAYMGISWSLIFAIRTVLILIGLVVVAYGINLPIRHPETRRPFSRYYNGKYQKSGAEVEERKDTYPTKYWELITMPIIFWPWDNYRDGMMGDTRGWYYNYWKQEGWSEWFARYHWLAIRNPTNNLRFVKGISAYMPTTHVTVLKGQPVVEDELGQEGFQILKGTGKYFNYYTLYYVAKANAEGISPFIIRLGHKIKLSHNDTDWTAELNAGDGRAFKGYKGFTFRIGFNKKIS